MGKGNGLGDQVYIGGYNVGGDIQQLQRIYGGPAALDYTDITQKGFDREPGNRDGGFEMGVYFDPATGALHDVASPLPRTDTLATYHHVMGAAAALGDPAASCVVQQTDYAWSRNQDGGLIGTLPFVADGYGLEWGVLATPGIKTDGAAGNGASVDLGSVSPGAFGLQMYLHLFAFTGTSVTVKLQSSTDNSVFNDITGATFAAASTAHTWQRVAVTGQAVNRYVRAVSVGTFSNAQYLVQFTRNPIAGQTF